MANGFDLFIYLDEGLVRNLSSLLLTGYIDIRTHRTTIDRTLTGRVHLENRQQLFEEHRHAKAEREGYKEKNHSDAENCQKSFENESGLEHRDYEKIEDEVKKIYTVFGLHNELITGFYNANMLTHINESHIINNKVSMGEYIEINGEITTVSIVSYVDIIIDILTCYGTDNLNTLLEDKKLGRLNFTGILNMMKHLKELLTANDTEDLIVKSEGTTVVLTVNTKYFLNKDAYIFDKVHCGCKIMGKIAKITDNISLLRKTSQYEYYEKLLESLDPFLNTLQEDGIIIPDRPSLKITGRVLVMAPISICI